MSAQAASLIHPTAIIHPTAKLGVGVSIAPYAVIGEDVILHDNVSVGSHAVIEFAEVGAGCQIFPSAFVGTAPQDLKYAGEKTRLIVGPGCRIREGVTLNRGTTASGVTKIGARCLFMANSHVAHDCIIGDEVIAANSVAIAGHCEVGDGTILGGMVGLHQFVRVGKMAMVGAGAMVPLDIPPFTLSWGDRARLSGLNLIGLKRRGFKASDVAELKQVFRSVYDSQTPLRDLVPQLLTQYPNTAAQEFLKFIADSVQKSRGITRPENTASSSGD
jgi:UDP-N-acetylglucosamine acyltransferase